MGFWDDLQSKAKEVVKRAEETFEDVKETTSVEFRVMKLKRQISLHESEIKELYGKIGKRVYDLKLMQPEGFADPEIQALCSKITEELDKISELEKEIIKIREESAERDQPADTSGEGEQPPPGKDDEPG